MEKELPQKKKIWSTLSSKIVHKNPWFHIVQEKFITPIRAVGDYYIMHPRGTGKSVVIIPIDGDDVLFVKQYRYVMKRRQIELPMGGVEKGHTALHTAHKELEEELGYRAGSMKKIGAFYPYNGPIKESCVVYMATDLVKTQHSHEETEIGMQEVRYRKNDIFNMVESGIFTDGQTITALALARKYF